jgi:S1-C subfamily serine protease
MKKTIILSLLIIFVFSSCAYLMAQDDVTGSIVKIYTVYNKHSYFRPWQMEGQRSITGSGCIIEGNRILTNAHVVADATFLQVKRAGTAKKYTAEVEIVGHECDLAILKVGDSSFFKDTEPVEIGDLAEIRDDVATYGFPAGGEELAITEGVVSRVELQDYSHSSARLLSCQIDAAINPGSSGGPVIKKDKIVGVAFEAMNGENIGYMVPVPVIDHFLKDIEDGKYDGIPGLGLSSQKIENPDMKNMYSMSEDQEGILVNKVYPGSPAKGILKEGDVILSVEGINVANDGTVEFRENERTSFEYVIQSKHIGDTVAFEILRGGLVIKTDIKLTIPVNHCRLVPHEQYDMEPAYYIVGGLVFMPLTSNYLDVRFMDDEYSSDNLLNLFPYYDVGEPSEKRRGIVVLATVLADEINVGYQDCEDIFIVEVNRLNVGELKDLVEAVEKNEGRYHVFVDSRGRQIVMDREKMDERSKTILKNYKVAEDRSEDLRDNGYKRDQKNH